MKKRSILILIMVLIVFCITAAYAASYPEIRFCSSDSFSNSITEATAFVGDTYSIRIRWFPAYDQEGYEITVYDSKGNAVGEDSKTWTNTASEMRITVTWDTTGYTAGRYRVAVKKKYYSSSRWNTVPATSDLSVTLKSKTGVRDFVERCYSLILGRKPDEAGLRNWVNALSSGTANASQIISGFMNSEEFTNRYKNNSETVEILYNTMLGRSSDSAGKQAWVGVLNGNNVNTVINGFCGSQEFLELCTVYGIEAGSVAVDSSQTRSGIDGFVARCYSEALGRAGDESGVAYWTKILTSKTQTPQQVAAGFVYSQEMDASRKLVNNPDALLDSLYKLYLGRPADEAGKAYWKQRIAEGLSLDELNAGFANSAEFAGIVAGYGLN